MEQKQRKEELLIRSPLKGKIVSLDKVADEVFSTRVLGEGCAILPENGRVCSPVNGKITSVAETGHAFGFIAEDGTEIVIRTIVLKDQSGKTITADAFPVGSKIDAKGVVDVYNGVYQLKVFSVSDVTFIN